MQFLLLATLLSSLLEAALLCEHLFLACSSIDSCILDTHKSLVALFHFPAFIETICVPNVRKIAPKLYFTHTNK